MSLHSDLVRLAHKVPSLRQHLLPLLKTAYRSGDIVKYKGKNYRLLWSGRTRYGERAKLQFMNGSKEFWVDLHKISPSSGGYGRSRSNRVRFRYWNGRTEWMSEEDAAMEEDLGRGAIQ